MCTSLHYHQQKMTYNSPFKCFIMNSLTFEAPGPSSRHFYSTLLHVLSPTYKTFASLMHPQNFCGHVRMSDFFPLITDLFGGGPLAAMMMKNVSSTTMLSRLTSQWQRRTWTPWSKVWLPTIEKDKEGCVYIATHQWFLFSRAPDRTTQYLSHFRENRRRYQRLCDPGIECMSTNHALIPALTHPLPLESQMKVRMLRDNLNVCKSQLKCKRDELKRLWLEDVKYKKMLKLIDNMLSGCRLTVNRCWVPFLPGWGSIIQRKGQGCSRAVEEVPCQ